MAPLLLVSYCLALCVARQVTQSYLPRVCAQRESELDEKERKIQEKIKAKLDKTKDVKDVKKAGVKAKISVLPQIDNLFEEYNGKVDAGADKDS